MLDSFDHWLKAYIKAQGQPVRFVVGLSGGVDSCVLLKLLSSSRVLPDDVCISAIHINHGLSPQARRWAAFCADYCGSLNVDLKVVEVAVDRAKKSLEEAAREARYDAFKKNLRRGDVLVLGHHQDDQAETYLLRLLRGSGSLGLGAMLPSRRWRNVHIIRPLLTYSRAMIEAFACDQKLRWIEDPSNADVSHRRNFLRLEVLPVIENVWPAARDTIARAAAHQQEAVLLMDDLARLDLERLAGLPVGEACSSRQLPIDGLKTLPVHRLKNLLRYWIREQDFSLPNEAVLLRCMTELICARSDAMPLIEWGDQQLRRFRNTLFIGRRQKPFNPLRDWVWSLGQSLYIEGVGTLTGQACEGAGIKVEALSEGEITVRFRSGGERCRPTGRGHRQTLKKLFQEYRVPPWLRDRIPLIYVGETLIAAVGYWVCEGYQAKPGEAGLEIHVTEG